jgi:acyl-CoA thioesterase-1
MHYKCSGFFGMMRILCVAALIGLASSTSNAYSASKTILVLGDSLSAEYGLTHGTGWVPLLGQRLEKQKIDFELTNASVSGETTSGGRERLDELLEKYRPAVVILELGANDGLRGLSLKSAEANLRDMIRASQKAHAKVLLLGMRMPPNYGGEYTRQFSSMYPDLAKETRCTLLPFFLEPMAHKQDLFQADGLHPTEEAQPLLADAVWIKLKPLLANGHMK